MRSIVSVLLIVSMMTWSFPFPLASLVQAATPVSPILIDKVARSTALLFLQMPNGTMEFACTATAIEKTAGGYMFITAAHCLGSDEGERSARADHVNLFITYDEQIKRFFPADLLAVGFQKRGDDFALLHVETVEDWVTIGLGDDKREVVGSQVLNVSSPLGLGKQILFGSVSQLVINRPLAQADADINWRGGMLLQMPGIASGASGSVIVSAAQEGVIGIIVGTMSSARGGTATIALPISRFKEFRDKVEQNNYRWYKRQ